MATVSKGNFIAGRWIKGKGRSFSSENPSNNQIIWTGNCSTPQEIDVAIVAAHEAFASWSKLDVEKRISYLQSFVDVLKVRKADLATKISIEIGKPQWEALTEIGAMIGKIDPTIQAYRERNIVKTRQQPNGTSITRFRPHGIVAVIGPFNFPGHMPNGHIMPALLAGNSVILKPSEYAPAFTEQMIDCWNNAGLPPGVISLLQGDGTVGQYLCKHDDINGIFFTGSRHVGEAIRTTTSVEKIVALEMGGNSPLIVWDASNINAAVFATIQSAFITSGQRCSSARRLIIPNNNFGETFISKLVESCRQIHVGRPDEEPEPYMGPLRLPAFVDRLLSEQERLISNGAQSLLKAEPLEIGPSFVTPGIIDVTQVNQRNDEEIIGPLLRVIRVDDFESALVEANSTKYGLAAGIFTEDATLYNRFQDTIKAGIINWNQQLTGASGWAPFGGIKQSGNYRPSAYFATDYCVYSTASMEMEQLSLPDKLPSGLIL